MLRNSRVQTPKTVITIEVKYGVMRLHEGVRLPRSRPMWHCPDAEFYVVGPLAGKGYEQAANLAMQWCCERRIPVISLTRFSITGQK